MSRLLFGSVRREVLALLLGRPDERFYLREIVRAVGAGVGAVQRELEQLTEAGLIHRVADGKQVYFSANREAPIFPDLRAIVEKTAGAADVVRASLAPLIRKGSIELALVYGSVAAGRQSASSDVDLMVVGDAPLSEVIPMLRVAEKRLGREVNASVYSRKEFRRKLQAGAPFLRRVMEGPVVYVTGDKRALGKLGR